MNARTCVRLLHEAGFVSPAPNAERLDARASIESARQLVELLLAGTVRMSAVIKSLAPQTHGALIAAIERATEKYREGSTFMIPAAAILTVGTKAA